MNNIVSFKRLWTAVKRTAILNWKALLIATATVGALQLLKSLGYAASGQTIGWSESLYLPFLFIGGMVSASISFREYSDKDRNLTALTLPISSVERFLEKWIVMTPGFILISLLFVFAVSLIGQALGQLIFHNAVGIFNPFIKENWAQIPNFLVVQALFYMGSAWFKKASFFKTLLSIILFSTTISILMAILFRILFGPIGTFFGNQMFNSANGQNLIDPFLNSFMNEGSESFFKGIRIVSKIFYWSLLPLSYGVAWLCIREKEVKHGV